MKKARLFIALITAKLLVFLIRLLGRGKGTSLPGSIALKIYPGLISDLSSRVRKGVIVVTGTNGKTTTNNMIARILEAGGGRVLINREGANLINGVAAAFAREMNFLNSRAFDYACLEVDEAAFPGVASRVRPCCVVITNFFRDQLDRYGELDRTIALVRNALKEMEGTRLVLNADDPLVAQLGRSTGLQSVFYGVAEHGGVTRQGAAAREAKFCPFCGHELAYRYYQYSQLGSYSCPGCDFSRPDPDVEGTSPRRGGSFTQCRVRFRQGSAVSLEVPVYGMYNLYNALAAYATTLLLDMDPQKAAGFLKGYRPATGRMERFDYRGKPVYLNLVKNPTGFNEGIGALVEMSGADLNVMIAINDNDADGRDISWLWDVDFEILADCQERIREFVCSGYRAEEMALRLKYAGILTSRLVVEGDFNEAVSRVLGGGAGKTCILATYTALWPVERILSGYAKRDHTPAEHLPHVS
ncbi:MAG: MurT ligase domain-containing protein [Actinobacteria bacterium]|nr:MurT ligase domain-containing protein [Actinomycetota bacterium]